MQSEPLPLVTFLTASVTLVVVGGAPLALAISFGLLRLYRGRLLTLMNRTGARSSRPDAPSASHPRETTASARELARHVRLGPRRDVFAYAAGVGAYAIAMTGATCAATSSELHPVAIATLFVAYGFPFVPMFAHLRAGTRDLALALILHLLAVLLLGAITSGDRAFTGPLQATFAMNAFPSLAIAAMFLARNGRAGPMVYAFLVFALVGPNFAMLILDRNQRSLVAFGEMLGLSGIGLVGLVVATGLLAFVAAGLGFLLLLRRSYVRKWISDRSLALDAFLLPYAMVHAGLLLFEDLAAAAVGLFVALAAYRLVVVAVQLILRAAGGWNAHAATVLFLRVFRATGQRDLFARWSDHWRYAGAVRMIAGPDLVTSTVEPHELLDFLFARFESRFIEGEGDLQRALGLEDLHPDLDGRHRVSEYFCRSDTWQAVFRALAAGSEAIVMDLRGFQAEHQGARMELETVARSVDPARVVLIVDARTDHALIDQTLGSSGPAAQLVTADGDVTPIVDALCRAAGGPGA